MIVCDVEYNVSDVCIDCEKLKIFKTFDKPCLEPERLIVGGSLPMGIYQFLIAYCDMEEEIDIENIINYFEENYEGKLIDNSHINVFVFEIDKYYDADDLFTEIKDIYYKYKQEPDDIRIRLEIEKTKKEIYMKFYLEGEDSIEPVCFGSEKTEDIIDEIHLFKQDIVTRLLLRVLYQTTKQTFAILSKTLHNHDLDKTEVINHLNIAKEINQSLLSY